MSEKKSEKHELVLMKEVSPCGDMLTMQKNDREFSVKSSEASKCETFLPVMESKLKEKPTLNMLIQSINQENPTSSENFDSRPYQFLFGEQDNKRIFTPSSRSKQDITPRHIALQLEEIDKSLNSQIFEIKKEISSIYYYIQKFQKQIGEVQLYEIQRIIFELQHQAMCQKQELDSANKRINNISQQLDEVKNVVSMISRYLIQLTIYPPQPGLVPQLPIHPIPQGFPSIYSQPQQQMPFNQPKP